MEQEPAVARIFTASWLLVTKTPDQEGHQYALSDREGTCLGLVRRQDTSPEGRMARRLVELVLSSRPSETVRLEVAAKEDAAPLLTIVFPSDDRRHRAVVHDAAGAEVGEIVKAKGPRKIHFDLKAGGMVVGTVAAQGWTGWDYRIERDGAQLGRIIGNPISQVGPIPATTDDYLLQLDVPPAEPLRTLVVACLVGMDASVGNVSMQM